MLEWKKSNINEEPLRSSRITLRYSAVKEKCVPIWTATNSQISVS
jgi:hypothetical protein